MQSNQKKTQMSRLQKNKIYTLITQGGGKTGLTNYYTLRPIPM